MKWAAKSKKRKEQSKPALKSRDICFDVCFEFTEQTAVNYKSQSGKDLAIPLSESVHFEDAKILGAMLASRLEMRVLVKRARMETERDFFLWLVPIEDDEVVSSGIPVIDVGISWAIHTPGQPERAIMLPYCDHGVDVLAGWLHARDLGPRDMERVEIDEKGQVSRSFVSAGGLDLEGWRQQARAQLLYAPIYQKAHQARPSGEPKS